MTLVFCWTRIRRIERIKPLIIQKIRSIRSIRVQFKTASWRPLAAEYDFKKVFQESNCRARRQMRPSRRMMAG
jgi:hypothetical protein